MESGPDSGAREGVRPESSLTLRWGVPHTPSPALELAGSDGAKPHPWHRRGPSRGFMAEGLCCFMSSSALLASQPY